MPLLQKLADRFVEESNSTFQYHCHECDAEFESEEVSTGQVDCPDCGAKGSRHIEAV